MGEDDLGLKSYYYNSYTYYSGSYYNYYYGNYYGGSSAASDLFWLLILLCCIPVYICIKCKANQQHHAEHHSDDYKEPSVNNDASVTATYFT